MAARLGGSARLLILVFSVLAGLALLFVVAPLVQLFATQTPSSFGHAAADPSVRAAIALSVATAFVTAAIALLLGVPLAYLLARHAFPGKSLAAALVDLPLAVPHTVVGIALLLTFGRTGWLGILLGALTGVRFWGTAAGIVVAMLYVSLPYTVNAARIAFEAIEPDLEHASRTLGAGAWVTFSRVTLPLAWRGILTGAMLSGARALSEFGAIVILAYYPMVAPVKIYDLFLQGGLSGSSAAAVVFLLVVLVIFAGLRWLTRGGVRSGLGG
ncbi:MAG TPA: ABC transporter permease [Candidatus Dormibacteraeota bacterium]|nr:ABC transporter permease [Candidatus Dormibacteraeota bacterium]